MPAPFSIPGSDITNPIPAGSLTYISDINNNFAALKAAILGVYAQVASPASNLDAGILEVNGNFQLTRIMPAKSGAYPVSGSTARAATANYANVADGTSLGYAGTSYQYHPTTASGWYIARNLMSEPNFGTKLTGPTRMRFPLAAAARTNSIGDEDWPALYQPLVHQDPSRFAGRQLTIHVKYTCTEAAFGRLYAAWFNGSARTEALDTVVLASGTNVTTSFTFNVDSDATHLEFGVLFESASAFNFDVEYLVLTDNPNRIVSGRSVVPNIAAEKLLVARHFNQTHAIRSPGMAVAAADILAAADVVYVTAPAPAQVPLILPDEMDPNPWPNAELYAAEAVVDALSYSGSPVWNRTTHSVTVEVVREQLTAFSPAALALDGIEHHGEHGATVKVNYTVAADNTRKVIPGIPFEATVELTNLYPPLF